MSINNFIEKIKNIALPANSGAGEEVSFDKDGHVERFPLFRKLFLTLVIILVAVLSFGIGKLSVAGNREPIKIEYDSALTEQAVWSTPSVDQTASAINTIPAENLKIGVIASRNGSKYHYPHCSGAKQIKEGNKIVFATSATAEAAGYSLAVNCKSK